MPSKQLKRYKFKKNFNIPLRVADEKRYGAFISTKDFYVGKFCMVPKKGVLKKYCPELLKDYPANITLKIYVYHTPINLSRVNRTIMIKRIAWLEGIAPKTYELIEIEANGEVYSAQIQEYIDELHPDNQVKASMLWNQCAEKLSKYYISSKIADNTWANFRGDKLIDYDIFTINYSAYKKDLMERYRKTAWWGNSGNPYQSIPEMGIAGSRTYERYEKLGIANIDLTGKTVLDIGCSGGQVLNWALKNNAARVVGVDLPDVAKVTFELFNYYKHFNVETIGADLSKDVTELVRTATGIEKFDVVTMFSMNQHIGFHKYMKDLCGGVLYLETNAGKMPDIEREWYPQELSKLGYTEFEYRGQVDESGGRSLFICR